jgi:hypothetical protein
MTSRFDDRPAPRIATWLAVLAVTLGATACASMRLADERSDYYRKELSTFTYGKACLDVWPSVLKLVGSKGYPLQGRDRPYADQAKQGALASFVEQGYETRAVEGGGLVVLTGWLPAAEGSSRYEVTGNPGQPSGCAVTFTYIWTGTIDPSDDRREPDWRIQLELLKTLQPDAAARVEGGAPKGG